MSKFSLESKLLKPFFSNSILILVVRWLKKALAEGLFSANTLSLGNISFAAVFASTLSTPV